MIVLSIDVGIRNLALCLIDTGTKVIHQWEVDGVPPESSDGLYVSLRKHLDARPWVLQADTVLIEKQPERNRKMQCVEHFLNAYFVIKCPNAQCILYHAKHKVPDVSGPGKKRYTERKNTSIERCKEFIEETNPTWLPLFVKSKKKDDLADTVMQALSYSPSPLVVSSKKKIVSRKPNENQKMTRYSKPNLVWLAKNSEFDKEVLLKDKRFMKDLSRYFSSIDEFLSSCIVVP
jgi:hypothetical protein